MTDLPGLEVGLAVQVAGVDVAHSVGVGAPQQEHVGGDHLVVGQVHQVADAQVAPEQPLVAPGIAATQRQKHGQRVVHPNRLGMRH